MHAWRRGGNAGCMVPVSPRGEHVGRTVPVAPQLVGRFGGRGVSTRFMHVCIECTMQHVAWIKMHMDDTPVDNLAPSETLRHGTRQHRPVSGNTKLGCRLSLHSPLHVCLTSVA